LFSEKAAYRSEHFKPLKNPVVLPTPDDKEQQKALAETAEPHLDGNPQIDRPLFVQFCANDPDALLAAAKIVQPYCDAVDLNLGCPQGIAKRGNYGAFLQEDWDLIYRLIHKLHLNLDVPVTAKMRVLDTKEKTLEYAKMILSAGASILTVHGRQRDQKGHWTGLADWKIIRYLRDNLPKETVMFANGNILQYGDLQKCLDTTRPSSRHRHLSARKAENTGEVATVLVVTAQTQSSAAISTSSTGTS
jgi:tRNA-dihydrouridine synthase 1